MIPQMLLRRSALGLALLGAGLLADCAPQQTAATVPAAATDQSTTEGTVTFTGGAVAAGIGFQWGSGTLTFRGAQYPFRVRGLSVIDVGVSRISATGTVTQPAQCRRFQRKLRLGHGGCDSRWRRRGKCAAQSERCRYRRHLHLTGRTPDGGTGRRQHYPNRAIGQHG